MASPHQLTVSKN